MKMELETLMSGASIKKYVHEEITYAEIDKNAENIWNFLFFNGYLKKTGERLKGVFKEIDLSIPNLELKYIYEVNIREWFEERLSEKNLDAFFHAILNGNVDTFQRELTTLLVASISFMDSAENFYHDFMAGVLSRLNGYRLKSNRDGSRTVRVASLTTSPTSDGRSDLVMYADDRSTGKVVIFELKRADNFPAMPAACLEALHQIEIKNYAAEWISEGYTDIIKYGVAFYKKRCLVMTGAPKKPGKRVKKKQ
jgi:hypothetical protein